MPLQQLSSHYKFYFSYTLEPPTPPLDYFEANLRHLQMSQNVSLKHKDSFKSTHTISLSYVKKSTIIFIRKHQVFQFPVTLYFLFCFFIGIKIKIKSTHCVIGFIHILLFILYWCFNTFH